MTYNIPPKIYIACLASYNNGILHGAWVDAALGIDHIQDALHAILKSSPIAGAEEWAVHDYEDFETLNISEYEGFDSICEKAEFIENHGALGTALADYFGGDLEEAEQAIESQYCGAYDNITDYAREFYEECGLLNEVPEHLARYIDFEAIGRDMDMAGDIFTIALDGAYHIFRS